MHYQHVRDAHKETGAHAHMPLLTHTSTVTGRRLDAEASSTQSVMQVIGERNVHRAASTATNAPPVPGLIAV